MCKISNNGLTCIFDATACDCADTALVGDFVSANKEQDALAHVLRVTDADDCVMQIYLITFHPSERMNTVIVVREWVADND